MALRFKGRGEKPRFQAALQADGTLEMLVYEDIGEDYWSYSAGITAKTIRQQIDAAPNASRIAVRIDSDGGDAFDGIAIYNVLRATKKPIDVYVDGLAASAASIIAMAGDTITMGVNTCMMIHNAAAGFYGDANYFRKQAEALDTVSEAIAQTYVAKTGKQLDQVKAMMDAETWMTAQECLEQNFCTALTAESGIEQPALVAARRKALEARLERSKAAVRNEAKTKRVDGEDLTWECFIVALDHNDPETWHLPYKFSTVEKTKSHLRDALGRIDQVKGLSKEQKHAAYAKLVRLCKQYGIEVSQENAHRLKVWAAADGVCACGCENCMDGNCSECTDPDCEDPNCENCPMQAEASARATDRAKLDLQFRKLKSASA